MVEIIKKGRLAADAKYTMHCPQCETVARFEKKEGREVFDQRDGDALVFNCPECKKELWCDIGVSDPPY